MTNVSRDDTMKKIIAREFRNALNLGLGVPVNVNFLVDEETTEVTIGDNLWRCEAGSDDDCFCFTSKTADPVVFDFPEDWLNVCETNVYDYFKQQLLVAPDDETLRQLPVSSTCGDDCKRAIDAAKTWLDCNVMAHGHRDETIRRTLIEATENIVSTFWRG